MLPTRAESEGGPRDWEKAAEEIRGLVEAALNLTAGPLGIWMTNGLEGLLVATPPGEQVPGGQYTREEWLMLSALFQWVLQQVGTAQIPIYVDEEGQVVTMTPEQVARYRRMPAPAPEELLLGATSEDPQAPALQVRRPAPAIGSRLRRSAAGLAAIPGAE